MAFITPLLIILVAGLAEVGWLANNYLILQEVTRVGARRGTVLTGDNGPLAWNNAASLVPKSTWPPGPPTFNAFVPTGDEPTRMTFRNGCVSTSEADYGFFNLIVCNMLRSMDPLELRQGIDPRKAGEAIPFDRFWPDDIVVSAFALQAVHNTDDVNFAAFGDTGRPAGTRIYVVGRYPTNANECNVDSLDNVIIPPPERDPFDYIRDGGPTEDPFASNLVYLELAIWDDTTAQIITGMDPSTVKEYQRGFAWYGQHKVEQDAWNPVEVDCIGSQWTIDRVEQLMNLPSFGLSDPQREFLPSQGMVLTEIFWEHELFLGDDEFPVFSPVVKALGTRFTTLTTWAAFPAPGAEPNISFVNP
jgi:hypothetical protein